MRAAAAIALALCAGCVTGGRLREQIRVAQGDVEQAKKQHAEACAPRELAAAEANLDFARIEMDHGDSSRAEEHLAVALQSSRKALAQSKECAPVQVVIRDKPVETPALVAPPPKVALKDSDGDGVPDIDDLCPDVPGTKENRGCPAQKDSDGDGVPDDIDRCPDKPGPKDNFGCPWPDKDGDGVPDKDDRCPETPGPVENQGCPWPDRDGDGVLDKDDKCPDAAGPKQNEGCPWADRDKDGVIDKDDECPDEPGPAENKGCPRKQTLIIVRRDRIELKQTVNFAVNRSRILKNSFELLRQVATALKDAPQVRVRVEGHTDNVGKLKHNKKLSQERADAVKEFLEKEGVEGFRMTAEGFGPTRPVAPNTSRRNRAKNRRVEFRIVDEADRPVEK